MKNGLICIEEIRMAAKVLRAVDHGLRRKILVLLERKPGLTVTELYVALRIEQSNCSHHLGILRKHGIVAVNQVAKNRYYSIVPTRLCDINQYAKALLSQ